MGHLRTPSLTFDDIFRIGQSLPPRPAPRETAFHEAARLEAGKRAAQEASRKLARVQRAFGREAGVATAKGPAKAAFGDHARNGNALDEGARSAAEKKVAKAAPRERARLENAFDEVVRTEEEQKAAKAASRKHASRFGALDKAKGKAHRDQMEAGAEAVQPEAVAAVAAVAAVVSATVAKEEEKPEANLSRQAEDEAALFEETDNDSVNLDDTMKRLTVKVSLPPSLPS